MTSHIVSHAEASASDRNLFLLFRRRFEVAAVPENVVFEIFADTRYRLYVNDAIVGYGPARFYPEAPEFDSYDIAPFLTTGANEIRVEVNSRNESSFQAVPSQPGFWARGAVGDADLSTHGAWQVKISRARSSESPTFSFAQGPVEILDVAALQNEWSDENGWEAPEIRSGWGELAPRQTPQPPFQVREGGKLLLSAPLKTDEERLGFHRVFVPPAGSIPGITDRTRSFAVALEIHSPREQVVNLGLLWGDNFLNGEPLKLEKGDLRGNRQNTSAPLRAGANLFYAQLQVLQPSWGFVISWARDADLQIAPEGLQVSEAMPLTELEALRGPVPQTPDDLRAAGWLRPLSEVAHSDFPAREVAWDSPQESQNEGEWLVGPEGGAGVALWDFERPYLGHFRLEMESEQGATLDIAGEEVRRADGLAAIYSANPFVNAVDRFIVPPGKTVLEAFHPRGGRFVQVTARSGGSVKITDLEERSALLHLAPEGSFECSDADFNEIWRIGAATTEACLPDVWVDCPWREQGAYLGDTLVEFHATRALSTDVTIGRRALRLWAQSQLEDGQLPACAGAWFTLPHGDFSLFYVLLLRDFWRQTGDVELVREVWPIVERIFASSRWKTDENGLWEATPELRLFLDWGIPGPDRLGVSNGALNALRAGALEAAAELTAAIGEDSTRWKKEYAHVVDAFRRVLWRPSSQDFAPFAGENETPAHHANALALRFGLASPEQESGVLANLRAAMQRYEAPENLKNSKGHLELFFGHFVLEALAERELHDDALAWIRAAWTPMLRKGAVSFWETLALGMGDIASLCHAWSCAPNWFFAREILGVHPVAGKSDSIIVAPHAAGLEWARGVYPHPRGPISVFWKRENGTLKIEAHAPEGVEIRVEEK